MRDGPYLGAKVRYYCLFVLGAPDIYDASIFHPACRFDHLHGILNSVKIIQRIDEVHAGLVV